MEFSLKRTVIGLMLTAAFAATSYAQSNGLQEAAGKAVQTNPEVMNKWHQFKAAGQERNVSWGRYLPTLDVIYGTGRQHRDSPTYVNPTGERHYNIENSKVMLKQNLFEGLATMNDTKRLEHAAMVRFYEMLDVSESAAFEASKAYIDVWLYRQLVSYAEDNYATHRIYYEKIKERSQSGVGRKVDFETAAGRLALAESNLLTEASNLHDVTARYQRIVGALPPANMDAPPAALLSKEFPKEKGAAVEGSLGKSPALKAAFENILSSMRNVDVQRAGYYPRLDAYAESGRDKNSDGYKGNTDTSTVGVTASWNLFRGFQDSSREKKAIEEKYSALDLREKVCRDVRQTASMSYNEVKRLTEQLQYLDQHMLSTDKQREAFRRQFDIGQRTLLDVLDTENEFYTARRNYALGDANLTTAHAKYQSSAGNLLNVLSLKNLEMEPYQTETTPEEGMLTTCPPEPVMVQPAYKDELFKRAQAKEDMLRTQPAAPAEGAAPAAAKPAAKGKAPAAAPKKP